jgi:hypothetical protein
MVRDFCAIVASRPSVALLGSVVLGALFTLAWAQFLHWCYRETNPDHRKQRVVSLAALNGAVERALVTAGIIWIPQVIGPVVAALIGIRAVLSWADLDAKTLAGRVRFNISIINTVVSLLWGMGWGIWAISLPQSN